MRRLSILIYFVLIFTSVFSQKVDLQRVEPPSWWVGLTNNTFQLMIYGNNISTASVEIKSDLVSIVKISKADSPNYLFIDLKINDKPRSGSFDIVFKDGKKKVATYTYVLNQKNRIARGLSTSDLVYLAMPDRFANGDPTNDSKPEMLEKANRPDGNGRHGGDIQGVIDHLDYFNKIGVTALWLNPLVENNMPDFSYHGYATTDFYKIDARFGSNDSYKDFVNKSHKQGLKVIQDVIFNHCGSSHWWIKDLPFKDWVNTDENFRTSYRGATLADPYVSKSDKTKFNDGWFVGTMPDLNQRNPFLAKYLIQNTLWWIEFAQLDAIRIDTYPYPDQDFMSELVNTVRTEYHDIVVFGETWLQSIANVAYFKGDSKISGDYNSHLNSVTDFPMFYATKSAFNENDGWTEGIMRLYYVLAQDFLYTDPSNLITFLDNHDLDRYYTSVGEDMNKFKMGIAFLLTTRGIPVVYYGTEIAMDGAEHTGHGNIRKDFPGGWEGDKVNVFTKTNLSDYQTQAFDYFSKIANWRKTNKPVTEGKLMQFIPENNVYVYFRYTDNEVVMVLMNNSNTETRNVDCKRFSEVITGYVGGTDIISGRDYELDIIEIQPKSALILELH